MGAKESTFNYDDPTPQCSIIELLRPECVKVKKKKKQRLLHSRGKRLPEAESLTLEEHLLASPSLDQVFLANTDVGEVCVLKPSKGHPSCLAPIDNAALSSKARDSLSMERPVNMHMEVEGKCPSEVSDMRRNENGRSRKRVRFRLPQESDIILICSPRE